MSLGTKHPYVQLPQDQYECLLRKIRELERINGGQRALLRLYEDWTYPQGQKHEEQNQDLHNESNSGK